MHTYIGKIDKKIYRCITENIVTDEVILTDEQLKHICDRHTEVSTLLPQMRSCIENPENIASYPP